MLLNYIINSICNPQSLVTVPVPSTKFKMLISRALRINMWSSYSCQFVRPFTTSRSSLGIFGSSHDETLFKRIARKLGWSETSKSVLGISGYKMYIKIADEIEYKNFFQVCDMEDTYASWFFVMELHIWMLSARLMEEGEDGKYVRNSMISAMWEDNNTRSKKLEGALASARRQQIQELNQTFYAALFSYDEGLLGSDKVLAGALWRRFLRYKEPTSQEELLRQIVALEMLVIYVRHQFQHLNMLSREKLVLRQSFQFTPFTKQLFEIAEKSKLM